MQLAMPPVRRVLLIAVSAVLVIVFILYPLALAITALAAQSLLYVLNVLACALARGTSESPGQSEIAKMTGPTIFSVHVPTHNEPPEVVIETLKSLRRQVGAPAHEIIVIDNNTEDPTLWQPVAEWCAANPGFRFLHREGVKGAKAGALNIALAETRPDATHIVTVDADYQVVPGFLSTAEKELIARKADFIQFPQAYRMPKAGAGESGGGIALELADYFDRHASAANHAGAMLLTGTLSVIGKPALEAVGGWSSRTATEDAELGLRLAEAGYRGAYVHKTVGYGLLPLSSQALHHQRHRWASGNMRTLTLWIAEHWSGRAKPKARNLTRKVLVMAQLTAWANFALPAVIALTLATVYSAVGISVPADLINGTTLLTLCLVLLSAALPLWFGRKHARSSLPAAICSRIFLLPTAATATIRGLMPLRQTFRVTPKSPAGDSPAPGDGLAGARLTMIWGCALGAAGMDLACLPVLLSGALLALPLLAGQYAARALDNYSAFVSAMQRQGV
ncbi:glycosyltransferase family 2 protein [uncultured Paracoccus sp.]|uniref:glycosyltransferase family 2 protein n=1 Tax=uncultured Paracoccus sp. TaxID=189685 RepID=UPI00259989B9|nr:glycosyltransferase family 2 protein [uncultured Paracoccus sp.]